MVGRYSSELLGEKSEGGLVLATMTKEIIMIRVSEDRKFKRAGKYSDALDLEYSRILTGEAKITSKSPYRLELAPSSRSVEEATFL